VVFLRYSAPGRHEGKRVIVAINKDPEAPDFSCGWLIMVWSAIYLRWRLSTLAATNFIFEWF
jgi:hypothetical protein